MDKSELYRKTIETKSIAADEEFDNFMVKVEEVKKLISGLRSEDKSISENALKLVDNYLGDPEGNSEPIDEGSLKVKTNKTIINKKALEENSDGAETQTPEVFMKTCEADAKRRTEERRQQKEASDTLKKQAVAAFKKGEFERALSLYNRAIDEFRGSEQLFLSRALTCLKLELYPRTLEDCGLVLRCFTPNSLRALLYKAKALTALGQAAEAEQCVQECLNHHPECAEDIREYMSS